MSNVIDFALKMVRPPTSGIVIDWEYEPAGPENLVLVFYRDNFNDYPEHLQQEIALWIFQLQHFLNENLCITTIEFRGEPG